MSEDWFENHKQLSEEQKQILFKEIQKFDEYGDAVHREVNLNKLGKKFSALVEYAERYLNENAENSFDQVTINRNIKELKQKVRKFRKEAEKAQKHQDRITALYDDIGKIFDRYFGIGELSTLQESTELGENELEGVIREEVRKVLKEMR